MQFSKFYGSRRAYRPSRSITRIWQRSMMACCLQCVVCRGSDCRGSRTGVIEWLGCHSCCNFVACPAHSDRGRAGEWRGACVRTRARLKSGLYRRRGEQFKPPSPPFSCISSRGLARRRRVLLHAHASCRAIESVQRNNHSRGGNE